MAPFSALSADVLAHVLGFLVGERWAYPEGNAALSCVQRLSKVVFVHS